MILDIKILFLLLLLLMFLLDLFILVIRCERWFSGATDYLDLIKYTQSYIKDFIKGYIDLIFIRHDIDFIYMDFNIFIYMDAVWYKISIIVETSIKTSILGFWYGWVC